VTPAKGTYTIHGVEARPSQGTSEADIGNEAERRAEVSGCRVARLECVEC
jgi:hypothetical protein